MSTYLDVLIDSWWDDEDSYRHDEWMTIKATDYGHVSFGHESTRRDGARYVEPEMGASFPVKHLDAVIDALVRLRAELPCATPALSNSEKP